jgi:hypothetical protein
MIDPERVPEIMPDELLARFATQSNQYRRGDGSVKQDLFMPHPRQELSVMRHLDATVDEIWQVGRGVAETLGKQLHGRADIRAAACAIDGLRVAASPILPSNPNHADVVGWPASKEDKKSLAQKLAAAATRLISPADND